MAADRQPSRTDSDQTEQIEPQARREDLSSEETLNAESLPSKFEKSFPVSEDSIQPRSSEKSEVLEPDSTIASGSIVDPPTHKLDDTYDQTLMVPGESIDRTEQITQADSSGSFASMESSVDQTLQVPSDSEAISELLTNLSTPGSFPAHVDKTSVLTPEEEAALRASEDDRPTIKQNRQGAKVSDLTRIRAPSPMLRDLPHIPGYEMLSEIGQGGMGVVLKARDVRLNRIVALKMIRSGATARREDRARFRIEAESVASLQHPNIVQIFEIGDVQDQPYFSLEFISGGSLHDVMSRSSSVHPRLAAEIVEVLARAMHYAHSRGILHRDLKPANVLIEKGGLFAQESEDPKSLPQLNRASIKITDFGLAKDLNKDVGQTHEGSILGTPSYMAPEQAAGKVRALGPPADVYALGAILYDLLASRPPFRAETAVSTLHQVLTEEPVPPRRLQPNLDHDLETICLKCLEKQPEKRYSSAEALADDLARYLRHEPILARATPVWEKAWKWSKRRPAAASSLILSLLLVLGLIAGGFIYAAIQKDRAEKEARLRAEAQQNLRYAHQAVKDMLSSHSDKLKNRPGLDPLRIELILKAIALYEKLVETAPADHLIRLDHAFTHQRIAEFYEQLEEYEKAIASYRRALEHFQTVLDNHSELDRARIGLAGALTQLATVLQKLKRTDEAEKNHRRAMELLNEGACADPEDEHHRQEYLADAHYQQALLQHQQGKNIDAKANYETAQKGYEALHNIDKANPSYLSKLAGSQQALATLAFQNGKPKEAAQTFAEALTSIRELRQQSLDDRDLRLRLAVTLRNHSVILLTLLAKAADHKQMEETAERQLKEALAILDVLVQDAPKVPEYQSERLESRKALGQLYSVTKQREKEIAVWELAERDLEQMRAVSQEQKALLELARIQTAHATALFNASRIEEAAEMYRISAQTYARLLKTAPVSRLFWKERLDSHIHEKEIWKQSGNNTEAYASMKGLIEAQRERVKQFPEDISLLAQLSMWERERAQLALLRNRNDEAREHYISAITHAEQAVEKSPKIAAYYEHLITMYLETDQYPRAAKQIEAWIRNVPEKDINYPLAAARMSQCALLAGLRKAPKDWEELQKKCQSRAMELLTKALERKQLTKAFLLEKAFDPLRQREDFLALEKKLP